jgi:hypothetical protein
MTRVGDFWQYCDYGSAGRISEMLGDRLSGNLTYLGINALVPPTVVAFRAFKDVSAKYAVQ